MKKLVLMSLVLVLVACSPTPTPGAFEVLPTSTPVSTNTPELLATPTSPVETILIEPIRKQIFLELADAQGKGNVSEEAYNEIAKRWGVTIDDLRAIASEGIEKGWLIPTGTPIPPTPMPIPPTPTLTYSPQPTPVPQPTRRACCKICRKGKACGDSCISRDKTCHQPPGCACNE